MTQRHITHAEPLPRCAKGHAARHIHDLRQTSAGGGHFIECRCCQTKRHAGYETAMADWRRMHGVRAPKAGAKGASCQHALFPPARDMTVSRDAKAAA